MKVKNLQIFFVSALVLVNAEVVAQNWQLVWSDEFTNGISSDWVFETGNGSNGWGNRELEYYRAENASVQNGQLVITAKRENFGGFNYTSVRMKTQGKKSWKYGKIEARIAMPAFQGVWPAFWMLGDNITQVNWPYCGEIDIMEHINTGTEVHGTIHWQDHNNQYANFGRATNTSVTSFHNYSIEWNATSIKWFVDGVQYNEANIANGVNGTSEFHNNFFILLNLAIGGNWPGFVVDNNAFPASMYVDYVRVYQDTGTPPTPGGIIQAENFSAMSGVQVEATADTGGGSNVGYIDTGDWMAYNNINFPTSGQYTITYRVASQNGGGRLSADLNSGATVLGTVDIPSTGGWQNWTTVTQTVNVTAGTHSFGIYAQAGGWNLNWFSIAPVAQATVIQAENYSNMSGVQTEATTDTGGGSNVGYIDTGDWMAYNGITFPTSGAYTISYRVASQNGGGRLSSDLNAGSTVLGALDVPSTGGWQNWTTISQTVNVNAGTYNFGVFAQAGGWNLNWISITMQGAAATQAVTETSAARISAEQTEPAFELYPNPVVTNELNLVSGEDLSKGTIRILDRWGKQVLLRKGDTKQIDVSSLSPGFYTLLYERNGKVITRHFLK